LTFEDIRRAADPKAGMLICLISRPFLWTQYTANLIGSKPALAWEHFHPRASTLWDYTSKLSIDVPKVDPQEKELAKWQMRQAFSDLSQTFRIQDLSAISFTRSTILDVSMRNSYLALLSTATNLKKIVFPPTMFQKSEEHRRLHMEVLIEIEKDQPDRKRHIQAIVNEGSDTELLSPIVKDSVVKSLRFIGNPKRGASPTIIENFCLGLGYTTDNPIEPECLSLSNCNFSGFDSSNSVIQLSKLKTLELFENMDITSILDAAASTTQTLERLVITDVYETHLHSGLPAATGEALQRLLEGSPGLNQLNVNLRKRFPNHRFKDVLSKLGPQLKMLFVRLGEKSSYTVEDVRELVVRCPNLLCLGLPHHMKITGPPFMRIAGPCMATVFVRHHEHLLPSPANNPRLH
jgi:hypothetical protein